MKQFLKEAITLNDTVPTAAAGSLLLTWTRGSLLLSQGEESSGWHVLLAHAPAAHRSSVIQDRKSVFPWTESTI